MRLILGLFACSVCHAAAVGCIGDSITAGFGTSDDPCALLASDLTALLGVSYASSNHGVNGASSLDWISGTVSLNAAIAAFTTASVTVVSIMIGTNDAKTLTATPQATYQSNVLSTITALKAAGFNKIFLNYSPYIVPGGQWDSNSDVLLVQYQTAINNLIANDPTHVFQGDTTAYSFFFANQSLLSDGVHPTSAGYHDLAQLWANAEACNLGLSCVASSGSVIKGPTVLAGAATVRE